MLVDLRIEWLALALCILQILLLDLLLLMLRRLVLESVLVEHLVLTLARVETISEAVVVFKLFEDGLLSILGADSLVFDLDLIECTLVNQSLILVVADLTLFTSLELLPGLFLNHSCIGIEVLTL